MDGTLLNGQNQLTNELKQYLQSLKSLGYQLVIATGRTFAEVKPFMEQPLFHRYICSNGMTIHNEQFDRIHYLTIQPLVLTDVLAEAAKLGIYYELRQDEGPGRVYPQDLHYMRALLQMEQGSTSLHEWHARQSAIEHLAPLHDAHVQEAVKVYFFHPNEHVLRNWRNVLEQLVKDEAISVESSSINSCEIVHQEASKGLAIETLIEQGFTEKETIICFGDSFNDVSMFKVAAYKVAMKNANDVVKQLADDVTEYTNDENGVYHWLKEHIKE